jgi:hypothetical protein
MSDFSAAWLRLREAADRDARDEGLLRRLAAALPRPRERPLRLVDLGAGTGALFRALAPLIGRAHEWLLVEHDPGLIARQHDAIIAGARQTGRAASPIGDAVAVHGDEGLWRARSVELDLAEELDRLDALAGDALVSSALFDLVSAQWLDRLAAIVAARSIPLYAALLVNGRRSWTPPLEADTLVRAAFGRDQTTDKGFGPALGPAAPDFLMAALARSGFVCAAAASDWRVASGARDLLAAVAVGEAAAARAARPDAAAAIDAWEEQRLDLARRGRLSLVVGHRDVLALPPGA